MKDQLRTTVLVSEGWQEAAMSAERQLGLAGTAAGRVVLHLLAFNFMARFGVAGWQESGPTVHAVVTFRGGTLCL